MCQFKFQDLIPKSYLSLWFALMRLFLFVFKNLFQRMILSFHITTFSLLLMAQTSISFSLCWRKSLSDFFQNRISDNEHSYLSLIWNGMISLFVDVRTRSAWIFAMEHIVKLSPAPIVSAAKSHHDWCCFSFQSNIVSLLMILRSFDLHFHKWFWYDKTKVFVVSLFFQGFTEILEFIIGVLN